jgi:superfamily I DNA/RNA helicase
VEDLLRYREGELLTFLLKLSPEQERLVNRALSAGGPVLVKGGAGSGKSTVALYRAQAILRALRKEGIAHPRILFTTYTNALINFSSQQLQQLLGEDMQYITVQTADHVISGVLGKLGQWKDILTEQELQQFFSEAAREPRFEDNPLQKQMQQRMLEKLGEEYLLQEFCDVIEARELYNLQAYLDAPRYGRRIRLSILHRKVIWSIYERFRSLVMSSGKESWQMRRTRAATLVEHSKEYQSYDAVIIDEAQDLDPSALRFLIKLCKSPNHIFVTADANQSIYGSGFNWSDVHECLNFKGRTGILQTNYRSTREIGEAAYSYLNNESLLDNEIINHLYVHEGPVPTVCTMGNVEDEIMLLVQFFRMATRSLHHPLGSCTLLCPNEQVGRRLAQGLQTRSVEATFMKGNELDLSHSGIKVLTLKSSKGLEFPIVALAGFHGSNYAVFTQGGSEEEFEEALARERRTIFVGMTRAMRALLVILPENADSPLMQGFQPQYWNVRKTLG